MEILITVQIRTEKRITENLAMKEAISSFNSDQNFRRWMTMLGGVYVQVSDDITPNPYLSQIPDQNIVSLEGKDLTLMNPAWALRSLNEFSSIEEKPITHITSLNLLRPENRPDEWERSSLESFHIEGKSSAEDIIQIEDLMYLRYMEPMFVQEGCLKCHGYQDYEVGDIRGGISVSVLYSPYKEIEAGRVREILGISSLIYLIVLFIIIIGAKVIYRRNAQIDQFQTQLLDSHRKLEDAFAIINRSSSVVILWKNDSVRTVQFASRNILDLFGYESREFQENPNLFFKRIHRDDREKAQAYFAGVNEDPSAGGIDALRVESKNGNIKWIDIRTTLRWDEQGRIGFIEGIITDITKRIKYEEEKAALHLQLSFKNKMDGLGQLAGGIAHDFNNILHGISSAAQLMLMHDEELDKEILDYANMIMNATERAEGLTGKLLSYIRKDKTVYETFDLHKIVDGCIEILHNTINKKIELIVEAEADHSFVNGERSGVENVFMNLIINASHAITDGGQILIITRDVQYDKPFIDSCSLEVSPGRYCEIEVRDNGCGIPEENLKKIFNPFYTTKDPGKGTGIGLTTVYNIIKNHGGSLNVSSIVGEYTSFRIALPCAEEQQKPPENRAPDETLTGIGTILITDDEEFNRILASDILKALGYQVLLASNGQMALELYKENHAKIDMVLLDMIMPVMDGGETFRELRKIDGKCPIVICSGFTKDESIDQMLKEGLSGFITKPFKVPELSKVVKTVINKKSPPDEEILS